MTNEISKELRSLVEAVYEECYGDHVVFDDFFLKFDYDEYGDEILVVKAIFEGSTQKGLRVDSARGLIRHLRNRLQEAGVHAFPITSFVEKSEWDEVYGKGYYLYGA